MLTTHYLSICKKLKKSPLVQNYKMHVEEQEDGSIQYTYKMKRGISRVQGAVKILQQMNYPEEIIQCIRDYK
jgi:DNA mismatch repair ATPase MutS